MNKGQSLVELIIALALVSIVLTSVVGLLVKGVSNNTFNKDKTSAISYADQALEWLRSERDNDWTSFYARSSTATWCIPSLSWGSGTHSGSCATSSADYISGTAYTREILFQRVANPTISVNATVTVYWSDSSGRHNASSTTSYTNWKGNQ